MRYISFLLLGLLWTGCTPHEPADTHTDGDTDVDLVGDTDVTGPLLDHATIGPEGGKIGRDNVQLVIPAGALAQDVELGIEVSELPPPDGSYDPVTPLFVFTPDGTRFSQPITVEFSVPGASPNLRVYWSTDVGGWGAPVDTEVDGDTVRATVTHFSTGFVSPPGTQTEVFTGVDGGMVDILLVVDNSCSMVEEQEALAAQFPAVMDDLLATQLEWHVGVVTTDMTDERAAGRLADADGVTFVEPTSPDPADLFSALVSRGIDGSATEQPLWAAKTALDGSVPEVVAHNADFYRADAQLAVVLVTDEEDHSTPSVTRTSYVSWFDTLKADPATSATHGIVGPAPSGCISPTGGADAGNILSQTVAKTGGTTASICDADWSGFFDTLVSSFRATSCHALAFLPDPLSLEVFTFPDEVVLSPGSWQYDAANGCLYLTPTGEIEAGGETFGVRYEPAVP